MDQTRELEWLQTSVGVLAPRERSVIAVTGDDAHEWLQGQLTNQCEDARPGSSVWLDVPEVQVAALLERLDRYVIMEDVDLEHRADLAPVVAEGPEAVNVHPGRWPGGRLGSTGRQWLVARTDLEAELEGAARRAQDVGGGHVSEEAWRDAHVVMGRPRFGSDFGEWTYPQESGLTPAAVSFTKGCYIGQETVVMLENRGKPPKVLWRWALEGNEVPPARSPIVDGGATVGELTSAVATGSEVRALGFLKRGHEGRDTSFRVLGRKARALGPVSEGLEAGGT